MQLYGRLKPLTRPHATHIRNGRAAKACISIAIVWITGTETFVRQTLHSAIPHEGGIEQCGISAPPRAERAVEGPDSPVPFALAWILPRVDNDADGLFGVLKLT